MIIPALNGTCDQTQFFLYTACDSVYFDEFAPSLVNSIKANTRLPVHVHIFNPTPAQISFCQQPRLSCTWEYVSEDLFVPAANKLDPASVNYQRTLTAMSKGNDSSLASRLQKTYYACARFIRLGQLFNPDIGAFAIDVDAIVRKPIDWLSDNKMYIHRVSGDKNWYMAGGIYLNPCHEAQNFITDYAEQLTNSIVNDNIYWGLDQDLLETTVPSGKCGQLPTNLIDWHMREHSPIWTAKGTRKTLTKFINEQKKYSA